MEAVTCLSEILSAKMLNIEWFFFEDSDLHR